MSYKTEQEEFWAGDFGNEYVKRNQTEEEARLNVNFFTEALKSVHQPESIIEFGANVGLNLWAMQRLFPDTKIHGLEINETAAQVLGELIGAENVTNQSIFEFETSQQFEVTLIKGVLIHINPDMLPVVYQKLYESSSRYILVCEYFNASPVMIKYRGHRDRLFKRDFAGEILDKFPDLKLTDYGFIYDRDPRYLPDHLNWFLLEKSK